MLPISFPYPSHYVEAGRLAVVPLDGLNPKTFCEPEDVELLILTCEIE